MTDLPPALAGLLERAVSLAVDSAGSGGVPFGAWATVEGRGEY